MTARQQRYSAGSARFAPSQSSNLFLSSSRGRFSAANSSSSDDPVVHQQHQPKRYTVAVVFHSDRWKDKVSELQAAFEDDDETSLSQFFCASIFYSNPHTVSLRVSLRSEKEDEFFCREAKKTNQFALFSSDLPYPVTEPHQMASAAKMRLVQAAVEEAVIMHCGREVLAGSDVSLVPFHEPQSQKRVFQSCIFSWRWTLPESDIWRYYGDEVLFYFAWFNHYNKWLLILAAVGSFVLLWFGTTVEKNPMVPLYSLFTMLWAVLFVKMWERKAASLRCDCHLNVEASVSSVAVGGHLRKGYHGMKRRSPITGEDEVYDPEWHRIVKQPISWCIAFAFLGISLFVQMCLLNLQGYMNSSRKTHELFEMPWVDAFSHEGELFDRNGPLGNVPLVLHPIAIILCNDVYRVVADRCTTWENYRTEELHEGALIQKRVVFEFANCFAALFYIAFYRLDLPLLRQELISMFMVDQVRRLLLESVLPFAWHSLQQRWQEGGVVISEHLPEYDTFEDYLELVMQFGYITLFAAAFPMAAVVAVIGNYVEIRSDIFKFTYVHRRPLLRPAHGIAAWTRILKGLALLSVVSNVLLFGITSHQMHYYFPNLFDGHEQGIGEGDEPFVVATIFLIEHVALGLALFLDWRIASVPKRVFEELQRRTYQRLKEHQTGLRAATTGTGGGAGTRAGDHRGRRRKR